MENKSESESETESRVRLLAQMGRRVDIGSPFFSRRGQVGLPGRSPRNAWVSWARTDWNGTERIRIALFLLKSSKRVHLLFLVRMRILQVRRMHL